MSQGLGCSPAPSAPQKHLSDETPNPPPLPQPPSAPVPSAPPEAPVPVPCDVACGPSFTLSLPETLAWPAGTYFFRVAKDANPTLVCSVVLEPVFGASQNNCNPGSVGFAVNYLYDSEVQRIESIDFSGSLYHLRVEVLTAETAPRLFEFEDDLRLVSGYGRGCVDCPKYRPSGTGAPEVDAGTAPDVGDAGTAPDAGDEPGDASTGLESDAAADSASG